MQSFSLLRLPGTTLYLSRPRFWAQGRDWKLSAEFGKFRAGLQSKVNSSNLFTQLYHKQQLVTVLKGNGIRALQRGIDCPSWSKKQRKKAGDNPVVLSALRLIQQHADRVYYLALVPDSDQRISAFFDRELRSVQLPNVPGWDVSHFGYLTWAAVKSLCKQYQLTATLDVFAYNPGQIFPDDEG